MAGQKFATVVMKKKSELKEYYTKHIVPELIKTQGYKNVHEVPVIEKIVINTGFGSSADKATIEQIQKDINAISGQKSVITRARISISNFKVREGMPLGVKVTLRGDRMYDFMMRLIAVALPGIRDFRGVPTKFDGRGNYTLGITDHTIFPEINVENNKRTTGLDICFVTTAKTDNEGRELLRLFSMPFRKANA